MEKNEFLKKLDKLLSQLPDSERGRHLSYYSELIDDMTDNGMTEQEAVARFGDVKEIANQILTETPLPLLVKTKVRPSGGWTAFTIVLAILACPIWLPIAISLLAVVFSIFVVLWCVVIAFIAVCVALVISGLALCIVPLAFIGAAPAAAVLAVGAGLICIGIGILLCFGTYYMGKGIVKLCALIGRGIKSVFIRKETR